MKQGYGRTFDTITHIETTPEEEHECPIRQQGITPEKTILIPIRDLNNGTNGYIKTTEGSTLHNMITQQEPDIRWEQNSPQDEKDADRILSWMLIGTCCLLIALLLAAAAYYLFIEIPYQEAINRPIKW